MPTPNEQKALAFVAIVILLGGAVRVLRAGTAPAPTVVEQQGITHQARAADSAASAQQAGKSKGRSARAKKPRPNDTIPTVIGGVSSVPASFARPDQPFAKSPYGYPPPGPRIDVDYRPRTPVTTQGAKPDAPKLDLDRASAEDIERLPRVGPALARRIVANRDSLGPFKSLEGMRRVKGMGPATLKLIAELVTFSAGPVR
jgi:competence protein ComEA